MYAGNLSLPTEHTFSTDFPGDPRYFASKYFKLVHHRVDRPFERCDFRIHLRVVDLDSHRQIAVGDLCNDASDFSERLLERLIGLLVLSQFSFQETDIFVFHLDQSTAGPLILLVQFFADFINHGFLRLNLLSLRIEVLAQVSDVILTHSARGILCPVPAFARC